MLTMLLAGGAASAVALWMREKSRRRTHPMAGGLHRGILLPHRAELELWHNAFSLCSKKVRLCLAELGLDYVAHHVDLIETGSYQTLSRDFLAVNPAALVPVLVHRGHPIYESHEIIRYAAALAGEAAPSLVPAEGDARELMDRWVHRSSLFGDDPMQAAAESAGNCVPGLTIPLFAAMIADIPASRIVEGLLFHRLRKRPAFFLALKAMGLARIASMAPLLAAIHDSRRHMERHLDELEAQLADGRSWICGEELTLADLSWCVIFDRLREADWTELLEAPSRPFVAAWWQRLRERPSYAASMLGEHEHPLVTKGSARIRELKASSDFFRRAVYEGAYAHLHGRTAEGIN